MKKIYIILSLYILLFLTSCGEKNNTSDNYTTEESVIEKILADVSNANTFAFKTFEIWWENANETDKAIWEVNKNSNMYYSIGEEFVEPDLNYSLTIPEPEYWFMTTLGYVVFCRIVILI